MEKLDLGKTYYTTKTRPEQVEQEAAQYLSIVGRGNPATTKFAEKTQTLYTLGYRIKFMCKALKKDFTVAKLEGLWWYDEQTWGTPDLQDAPTRVPRDAWEYRLLIRLPEYVVQEHIREAIRLATAEANHPYLEAVELYQTPKETAMQILHVGPFEKEPETLAKLQAYMEENRLQKTGQHHEIYLSDFRRTLADKLKTILRQSVKRA